MHSLAELAITGATLEDDTLTVFLSDGRIVTYPLAGMTWITQAPAEQQQDFTVAEWEIYWNQIDDGLTLEHILSPRSRPDFSVERPPDWERLRNVLSKYRGQTKDAERNGETPARRVPGNDAGKVVTQPDFDEPLPEFEG